MGEKYDCEWDVYGEPYQRIRPLLHATDAIRSGFSYQDTLGNGSRARSVARSTPCNERAPTRRASCAGWGRAATRSSPPATRCWTDSTRGSMTSR